MSDGEESGGHSLKRHKGETDGEGVVEMEEESHGELTRPAEVVEGRHDGLTEEETLCWAAWVDFSRRRGRL